jgi:hypothetical protein
MVMVVGIFLSGCGASNTGGTLPRPALLVLANAICSTASNAGQTLKPPAEIHAPAAAVSYLRQIAPISARETRALQALSPASDVKTTWEAFIAEQVAANRLLQSLDADADRHDPSLLPSLRRVGPADQAVVDAASALGATRCAR